MILPPYWADIVLRLWLITYYELIITHAARQTGLPSVDSKVKYLQTNKFCVSVQDDDCDIRMGPKPSHPETSDQSLDKTIPLLGMY